MPLLAALLILGLIFLLAKNIQHEGFSYFATISFIGLTNGSVYALVALGYTLVYGILELINFAHGDVFMLGGMISGTMHRLAERLRPGRKRASTSLAHPRAARLARSRDDRLRG